MEPMPPTPAPWLIFLITLAAVLTLLALITVVGGLSRMAKGQSFWPRDESDRPSPARSRVRNARVIRGSRVRPGSRGANPTLRHQDGTFAGSEGSRSGSEVRESSPQIEAIAPDLPQTMDELMWAVEAVRLRTSGEESTKEAAIIRAFPHVKSKGGGAWQRASQLYDTINSAQKTAQTKAPQPIEAA